jgi:hypothetical protein
MLIMVFNEALVEYIRHVLPSLGIEGVPVTTYRRWSTQLLRKLKLRLPISHVDGAPDPGQPLQEASGAHQACSRTTSPPSSPRSSPA